MDSIKRNNEYREKSRVEPAPVVIKKRTKGNIQLLYIVVGCTKESTEEMLSKQLFDQSILTTLHQHGHKYFEADIEQVLYCGNLKKFQHYEQFVYQFPLRKVDIREKKEPQYRYYAQPLEYQRNLIGSINLCNSPKKSWESVVLKVGAEYGVLLKIKITS